MHHSIQIVFKPGLFWLLIKNNEKNMVKRVIDPSFKDLPKTSGIKDSATRNSAIERRAKTGKDNIHSFYVSLFKKLKTVSGNKGRKLRVPNPEIYRNGNGSGFNPDVLERYEEGVRYVEIKGFCTHNSQVECAFIQFGRYLQHLIQRIENGDNLPSVDYALFKYSNGHDKIFECNRHGKKEDDGKKHVCGNDCLVKRLSERTHTLVVAPENLMLGLSSSDSFNSKSRRNQTNSLSSWNHQDYIILRAGACLSRLTGSRSVNRVDKLGDILDGNVSSQLRDLLVLDGLRMIRERSPSDISCTYSYGKEEIEYPVKPFDIVRFEMTKADERTWLQNLLKYQEKILYRAMGITNLDQVVYEHEF
jgi:hypothetical protein